ncbi:lactoylglutathione lyase [Altererythrobacter xixiisoli]|uniref:Lactoylglutathione lyase n=1 Tax=Croceibacterium xixiisoli TaxID=1476466 RepID=A0A6I4TVR1_9SPHN|nr:VOC family protein [Croceibacterium xixiisoli]MXO99340.1 lactoylglutathione lyase [Croceibacterium xixiisoli]
MTRMVFINLPVTDLAKSMAFYDAVGFTNNPQFTDDNAAAMMWSDEIIVMLLKHDFWKTFTTKQIPDAHTTAQVMLCLSQDSKEAVDAIVSKAVDAGGKAAPTPNQDYGFMYGRSFEDPDGHIWENAWMNMDALADGQPPEM